jgi:alpha-tubulin suppressor-like RCC1 family protein
VKKQDTRRLRVEPTPVKTRESLKVEQEEDDLMGSQAQIGFGLEESGVQEGPDKSNWPTVDLHNATSVSCGDSHTLAITQSLSDSGIGGEVYSWGCGSSARTGLYKLSHYTDTKGKLRRAVDPDTQDQFEANLMETLLIDDEDNACEVSRSGLPDIAYQPMEAIQVAAGGQHSLALQYDEETGMGCVLSWGQNEYGQLGRQIPSSKETDFGRYTHEVYPPVPFVNDDTYRITLIACGDLHCLALARNGVQLYSWGCAANGRLGYSCATEYQLTPRAVGKPVQVPYVAIDGGMCHSAALTRDKALFCWGKNDAGQCGHFSWGPSGAWSAKQVDKIFQDHKNKINLDVKTPKPCDVMKPTLVVLPASGQPEKTKQDESSRGQCMMQLACGENHTLALIGDDLWLLGSGLDQQYRRDNMKVQKAASKKQNDSVVFGKGFTPRRITVAFTDTAEISTRPQTLSTKPYVIPNVEKEDNAPGDAVRYTLFSFERQDEKEPDKPPEIEQHHCFTFTFSGDLDGLEPGVAIAFTGPTAPVGLRLESVQDGPWFKVLGEEQTEIEGSGDDDKPPLVWDSSNMKPNCKPFYEYRILVNDYREANARDRDPEKGGDPKYGGKFQPVRDRIEIMPERKGDEPRLTYMYMGRIEEPKFQQDEKGQFVKDQDGNQVIDTKANLEVIILASTLQDDMLEKNAYIRGNQSGAICRVTQEMELVRDSLDNPVVRSLHVECDASFVHE